MSKVKKYVALGVVVIIIVALLWYSPTIISYLQSSPSSSNASYTQLTLRYEINDTTTIEFGDTDYTISYLYFFMTGNYLTVSTFIGGGTTHNSVRTGDVYKDFGIEVKVSNVTSDYISNYIVILVKPTIQNYMASLMYTKVNITFGQTKTVSISSGLINKTNQYSFAYTDNRLSDKGYSTLIIANNSRSKTLDLLGQGQVYTATDFGIEISVYKVESAYMVIYVKPLY